MMADLTPEYLKGLILGIPQVGKGVWITLLGYTVLRKEKSPTKTRERMYPGKNVSWRESELYIYGQESHSNLLTIASCGSCPPSILKV